MKKKIFSTIVVMLLTMACFAIPALAWEGPSFNPDTVVNDGPPAPIEVQGYTYVGYAVVPYGSGTTNPMGSGRYTRVENLYLKTEDPMIIRFRYGSSGGLSITATDGSYYTTAYVYRGTYDGVYGDSSSTPQKHNSSVYTVAANAAFYPAVKMVNSDTGEEIAPSANTPFTLHAFLDSDHEYHFSVSCDDPSYDFSKAKVHFYHINGEYTPVVSASASDSGSYSDPTSYASIASDPSELAYYREFFSGFSEKLDWFAEKLENDTSYTDSSPTGYIFHVSDIVAANIVSNRKFDPEAYPPYQDRGVYKFDSTGVTADARVDVKMLKMYDGKSWFPTSDLYGLVAVVEQDGKDDIVLYYTFSRSAALAAQSKWIIAPIIAPTIEEPEEEITDLQTLADYLKYLASVTNNNNTTIYNNYTNELSDMPWSDYVYGGLQQWLPSLSSEFDTMFSGLFEDYFVPDLSEIEDEIDEQEESLRDKFEWVTVVKQEVQFITTSIGESGDNVPVFRIYIDKWGITDSITIFDGSWINPTTRMKVKDVITLFCTISLVMFIFRTLPSTIGRVPNE